MSTLVDSLRPAKRYQIVGFEILLILGCSLFLAFLAQIALPLPFSPIPVTMQTLGVFILARALGSKRAFAAVAAYLAEGCLGLPVFAGAMGGVARLYGPGGGYLAGFLITAFLMGFFFEKAKKPSHLLSIAIFAGGSFLILLLGSFWLSFFVGADKALALGFTPFILGECAKIAIATGLAASCKKWL